jgi:hypothetical protein
MIGLRRVRSIGWFESILLALLAAALVHAAYVLWIGLFQPLVRNTFRETQTAVSAYWIWRGGPWLAYETPVLGFPWAIPNEFPTYQWIVALLRLAGVPIPTGGKLVSFLFFIGCLFPACSLFKTLQLPIFSFLIFAILFLTSPFYLYFSGAVLIESCALFFGFWWLACYARFLRQRQASDAAWSLAAGSLATLSKLTTFAPFGFLGGILFLVAVRECVGRRRSVAQLLVDGLLCVFPLIPGLAWVPYTDAIKSQNAVGAMLTSSKLTTWNFGTLAQRLDVSNWRDIVLGRMLLHAFGDSLIIAGLVYGAALVSATRYVALVGAASGAFVITILVFTNLHLNHDYYQYSNLVFAIAAVAFSITCIAEKRLLRPLALLVLLAVVTGHLAYFYRAYAPVLSQASWTEPRIQIALAAKQNTSQDRALVVFGDDWSSVVPYYSERKAFVIPAWAPQATFEELFKNPKKLLGNVDLGGVVVCPAYLDQYGANRTSIEAFISGKKVLAASEACQLYGAAG